VVPLVAFRWVSAACGVVSRFNQTRPAPAGLVVSGQQVGTKAGASKQTRMATEAMQAMARYSPGMDARSTRVAERLNTPMLIAAALTLPMVAITE